MKFHSMKPEQPFEQIAFARELRRAQTPFEKKRWDILRAHQMVGFHFRRQRPIGPDFADFACLQAKLIIELDGLSHDSRVERDAKRDEFFRGLGWRVLRWRVLRWRVLRWRVLRFPNDYVRDDPDGRWQMIEIALLETKCGGS